MTRFADLIPDLNELIARARADLRMGVPVVLMQNGRAVIAAAAETLASARLRELRGLGDPVLAITTRRAETLKARAYSDKVARVTLPEDADTRWIAAIADPADDLTHPMKGPLNTKRGGEDGLEAQAVALTKSAQLLPAALVVEIEEAEELARTHLLTVLKLTDDHVAALNLMPIVHARLPMAASEAGRLHIFRPVDGREEHYAIEIGRPPRDKPVLARLHSACFTGDVLGSLKCDCGPQLNTALRRMGDAGAGVLLYLNQEGRGIGLANKMRAYSLQDQGFDTVEANHRLGFEDDERNFGIGSEILKTMGFSAVRLMTNNPRKVEMMQATGIEVSERVPLKVGEGAHNAAYLATKARKSGHIL
ncbi:GTP cyclohydrolase II [Aliiroseovarius crassostreae]|uniref:GTP cyclohydrolase-2 n=1 Tax=Aliiroseovarius crassostreae TaxID=154981 RepID=A0A0N8IAY9_9RHOB|nr:GTP cyclohydrolase II [Aliiroseovarius crassostreae]KPN61635.1 GTP cyclohydrolase [Aliiroseovarius crassostreae]SFU56139.1 GTP cyclohydrolase II [Aliiroseovarius crassostreae]